MRPRWTRPYGWALPTPRTRTPTPCSRRSACWTSSGRRARSARSASSRGPRRWGSSPTGGWPSSSTGCSHRSTPTSVYLVSDGAEDEYLYPIVASRVRIDGVRRVLIRQSATLESTYYTVVRALKDPKLRAKTILPVAFVLLILGFAAASGVLLWGVIGLAILLGVYLIFWTFDIDEAIIDGVRSASSDIRQGSVAFGFGLFTFALVGVGFLEGYNHYSSGGGFSPVERVLVFLQAALVWWVAGALVWETGRAIRRMIASGRFPRSFVVATTSVLGIGLVSYGIVFLVRYLEGITTGSDIPFLGGLIIVGLGLVIGAGVIQQHFRAAARAAALTPPTSG